MAEPPPPGEDLRRALAQVVRQLTPEGRLRSVEWKDQSCVIRVEIPQETPGETSRFLIQMLRQTVLAHAPSTQVNVIVQRKGGTAPSTFRASTPPDPESVSLPGKYRIAIASGKGGVGKSTVALLLAWFLHTRWRKKIAILDADLYGPSLPALTGIQPENIPAVRDPEKDKPLLVPPRWKGIPVMSLGFLIDPGQPVLWRGPVASGTVRQFLQDVAWDPDIDFLVIDLPPGTGDIPMTVAQAFHLTGVVLVGTPHPVAWEDVYRAIRMFQHRALNVPVLGVIENMAYFIPADQPERRYFLFGKPSLRQACEQLGIPYLGEIPLVAPPETPPDLPFLLLQKPVQDAFGEILRKLERALNHAQTPVSSSSSSASA